jgi:ATP-dependent protease ClpP protease subunit
MNEDYSIFTGMLDAAAMNRIVEYLAMATKKRVQHIHLLFQSDGGGVGTGVSLYYLFKRFPLELTIYNNGTVMSAGVIAYLGAKHRLASASATFGLHRTTHSLQFAGEAQFRAAIDSMTVNNQVTEALLRSHITLSPAQWEQFKASGELFFAANDAVTCGIADGIADFAPPAGATLSAI